MKRPNSRSVLVALAAAVTLSLTGCSATGDTSSDGWRTAESAAAGGGMDALIEAAQAEGKLNVMGLYPTWANYGELLDAFSAKYGIEVVNDTSQGTSQDQVNAIEQRIGQDRSLDYLDTGIPFADAAAAKGLLASYTPVGAARLPAALHQQDRQWTSQYGGYMSIGCDASRVRTCPTSFAALADPQYRGQVAALEDPQTGNMQFNAVWAMSLANGGSLDDITPGIEFIGSLVRNGNQAPVTPNTGTIERGETPIVVAWDYTNIASAEELRSAGIPFEVHVPTDALWSEYYAASINADAPNPAAARLWMEYIFSDEGQNIFLAGKTRPARMEEMRASGTLDPTAEAALPPVTGAATLASAAQREAAKKTLNANWDETVNR